MISPPILNSVTDITGLKEYLLQNQGPKRTLIAVAGPPGSGKSTFTEKLCAQINERNAGLAHVLSMDGFHYDDMVLNQRGWRARKGAPHTFDTGSLAVMLKRLHLDDGGDVAIPIFDRTLEIARAGADIVPAAARLILVEGNYLLLDDPAWSPIGSCFDLTVMLDVPKDILVERLLERWRGFRLEGEQLRCKMEGNDLPNVDLVLRQSVPAHFVVKNY